ncbi:hypothetical protein HDV06_005862 [Boothiomyces sp. JEL0866]|nr:hypothetical protein HDV06_005862 [Boothiomyces sp. JEL0866]
MTFVPQAKKLRFDEDGQVAETIQGVAEYPKEPEQADEEKRAKIIELKKEKRERLRNKLVEQEQKFHAALFGNKEDKQEEREEKKEEEQSNKGEDQLKKGEEQSNKGEEQSNKGEDQLKKGEEQSNKGEELPKKKKKKNKKNKKKAPEATSTDKETSAKDAALAYLMTFIENKDQWKFQKVRQTWILQNLYYQHQIDNIHFKHTLTYLQGMGDRQKKETIEEAKIMLEKEGITDTIAKRAKKIIKQL